MTSTQQPDFPNLETLLALPLKELADAALRLDYLASPEIIRLNPKPTLEKIVNEENDHTRDMTMPLVKALQEAAEDRLTHTGRKSLGYARVALEPLQTQINARIASLNNKSLGDMACETLTNLGVPVILKPGQSLAEFHKDPHNPAYTSPTHQRRKKEFDELQKDILKQEQARLSHIEQHLIPICDALCKKLGIAPNQQGFGGPAAS